jgi:trigger factor
MPDAGVAELVDALDLGSSGESRGGSSPSARTMPTRMTGNHAGLGSPADLGPDEESDVDSTMQVTETRTEGFHREFEVVLPKADLAAKVDAKLGEMKERARIPGFRPGKVPVAHLKRLYGRGAMLDVINNAVNEATSQLISERGLKLATEPKVTLDEAEGVVEKVIDGSSDLSYKVALEVVPPIQLGDFKTLKLEKLTTDVTDAELDEALKKVAEANRPYGDKTAGAKAETGDRVTISFLGKVNGEPFEGGKGDDMAVQIGSGSFIPGFETQLVGITAGEKRVLNVTFPADYGNAKLAGQQAEFDVEAKSIQTPSEVTMDDAFATSLGLKSLDELKTVVREKLAQEHTTVSRRRIKRELLDQLDAMHKFETPPTLVDREFDQVWKSILSDLQTNNRTFADENTTEDKAKEEYRGIAERRVRLGLVLAVVGEKNYITVADEELSKAALESARQFPGREQEVWQYYRDNPQALGSLRAPIFEEKVIDFLVELANVTEKKVSREDLYKDEGAEDAHDHAHHDHHHHDHDHDHDGHDHGHKHP